MALCSSLRWQNEQTHLIQVHLVPSSDDPAHEKDTLHAVERAAHQLLLRVTVHPSLAACVATMPPTALARVVAISPDEKAREGGAAKPLHSVDLVGPSAEADLYVYLWTAPIAAASAAVPNADRVTVPVRGLTHLSTPSVC